MVKPMQRLTKYSLLLRRLINHTDIEPERTSLQAMVNMPLFLNNQDLQLNPISKNGFQTFEYR